MIHQVLPALITIMQKTLNIYDALIEDIFEEDYRTLKPTLSKYGKINLTLFSILCLTRISRAKQITLTLLGDLFTSKYLGTI